MYPPLSNDLGLSTTRYQAAEKTWPIIEGCDLFRAPFILCEVSMLESKYQSHLIKKILARFPGCVVEKSSTDFQQGLPDLTVYIDDWWAKLEVKTSIDAPEQPNQRHFIDKFNEMSFASFISPETEEEVLVSLQQSFSSSRNARVSQC